MAVWAILKAEMRRYLATMWSYRGNALARILYVCLMFVAAVAILDGVSGGGYGREKQALMLVGWLTWQIIGGCIEDLSDAVSEEAQTGTLEQVCLSPMPMAAILAARSAVSLLANGLQVAVAGAALMLFVGTVPLSVDLLSLFLLTLVGGYGLGFLLAGLAMGFKRVSSLTGLVLSLMIFLTGSLVGLEKLVWVFRVTQFLLPVTWGVSLMRATMAGGTTLPVLWKSGELVGLSFHSLAYLGIGLIVFAWGYRTARQKGTLAHY